MDTPALDAASATPERSPTKPDRFFADLPTPRSNRLRDLPVVLHPADRHVCETCGTEGSADTAAPDGTGPLRFVQHRSHPLHVVKLWNGQYWRTTVMRRLGLIYQLGHGGAVCSSPGPERIMSVISRDGTHDVRFRYCECLGHGDEFAQLFRAGWFAARATNVKECVTFEMLGLGSF
ncbi:hypothetical protein C8F04DRAFT_1258077 [Mycena alexandri]|uniref:CxC2-like cysteine cluster KDZ transposase-associated domain-containing protein n=1 Tax=Mycena alexandri TaxID=1745969 RepID=A0AAD6X602_9AGAR|nr:hypothetical protein C8F04DRAFT_1258077 [Mycena alexandri]